MVINITLLILIAVLIIDIILLLLLNRIKEKNKLHKHFMIFTGLLTIPFISLSLQILFSNTNIPPVYFDYFTYIFTFIGPIELLKISLLYYNPNIKIKKFNIIYIVSVISLIILWTNDYHHLFYEKYSVDFNSTTFGIAFNFISIYHYAILAIAMTILVYGNIKRSGFFSVQTMFLLIGILFPLILNLSGVLKIFETNIYLTPISFVIMVICFYVAIFKLKALNIIPVASRTVMDTMSDAYVVISNDGTIADSNKTFREKFKDVFDFEISNKNLFETFKKSNLINLDDLKLHIEETRKNGKAITQEYHFCNNEIDVYFEIDIHPIAARNNKKDYIATLLVFKDITQHKLDIKEIEEKQDIIVKQQQLVSIGEIAGGVAHDINTPISAIKTGIVMLNTMSDKRTEAEKEILQRMDNCATKIINIVNSMRNQIRNLGGTTKVKFNVRSVVEDIKIITYHEVGRNNSKVEVRYEDEIELVGDPTKLGQVLTNLVVNGAQAYGNKGGKIDIIVRKLNNYGIINVIDYAGGIDESIKPYIFKNILTTKGISGTGLGLYIAYSVIKGEFNGELSFDSQTGEGTTFCIKIPLE